MNTCWATAASMGCTSRISAAQPGRAGPGLLLGEEFIGGECCAMILGDNIFYGNGFSRILKAAVRSAEQEGRATVFGYYVNDPERFGIVEFDGRAT